MILKKSIFIIDSKFFLNAIFALYFFTSFFPNSNSAFLLYFSNLIIVLLIFIFLILKRKEIVFTSNVVLIFLLLAVLSSVMIFPLVNVHIYTILFYFKFIALFLFVINTKLTESYFLSAVNKWYVLYAIVSILFWFNIIPNPNASDFLVKEEFSVNLFGISYYVMPGIEGSPANIDSYSGLVLLLNIFILRNQQLRYWAIGLAIVCIVASLRMTPIVALLMLFFLSPLLKNRFYFLSIYFSYLFSMLIILFVLYFLPTTDVFSINVTSLAYLATHARSMIWVQQLHILFLEYQLSDYLFGGYNVELFNVPTFQLTGAETGNYQSNPHNTFLLLFFRSPFLFCVFMFLVSYLAVFKVKVEYFIPLLFVLLACYTNSSILSLENPVYLMLIVFSCTNKKKV